MDQPILDVHCQQVYDWKKLNFEMDRLPQLLRPDSAFAHLISGFLPQSVLINGSGFGYDLRSSRLRKHLRLNGSKLLAASIQTLNEIHK